MKKDKKRTITSAWFHSGVIVPLLCAFFEKTRFLLTHGFFARLLTGYSREEALLENGVFSYEQGKRREQRDRIAHAKHRIAMIFEQSVIVGWIEGLSASMLYLRMRTYGVFLCALGSTSLFTYFLKEFSLEGVSDDIGYVILALCILFLSIPFLFSSDTLAAAMARGCLWTPILFRYFGFSRESFLRRKQEARRYGASAALGIAFGVLTYFAHPKYYFLTWGLILLGAMIFCAPEVGVLFIIALIPFVHYFPHPTIVLAVLVLSVAFAYLVKWIRGKRMFHSCLLDKAIVALMLLYVLGGSVTAGGFASFMAAIFYVVFLLAYFLIVNLLRSSQWLGRAWKTFFVSGTLSALLGMGEIVTGRVNASWVDLSLFSNMGVRITGGFDNPNVYAEFLLLLIPLALMYLLEEKRKGWRIAGGFALLILSVSLIFTWSRGAWLGLLIGLLLFALLFYKTAPVYLLGGVLISPMAISFLPKSISARFLSIGNFADSSVSYRFSIWRGVRQMLNETFWSGIGVGPSAFAAIYPAFAYGGSEKAYHAHSFYLQLLVELGVVGLLTFGAIAFFLIQMCFEYLAEEKSVQSRRLVAIGVSSILGLLVMGLTDHIWYDYRIFLSFWVIVGLVSARIRISRREQIRQGIHPENTPTQAQVDLVANIFKYRGI